MRSSVNISRRAFVAGSAAMAAVGGVLPAAGPALAIHTTASSTAVASGNPWAPEILARNIAEHLPGYLRAEQSLAAGDATALDAWDFHYRSLIDAASRCHDIEPNSEWERELRERAIAIWPTERQRARMRRPPIEGLSRRFQWINLVFEVAIRRVVDAGAAYDTAYIRYGDIQGAAYDADVAAYTEAVRAKYRLTEWMKQQIPVTAGDRELRRRLWEMAAGPQIVWERRELSQRKSAARGDVGGRKRRYKAGHLIDAARMSWG